MKTFKELREAVKDVSSMGDREIASIANNPKHPMHSAAKAEHDRRKMKESVEEKTLTPAEKKKREEIAKAMERDNPGMDMSKKMAIATAQAKKVAESKIDEISVGKMMKYGKAAAKDIEKHRGTVKTALDQPASPKKAQAGLDAMKKLTKRSKGSDMYVNKMTGRSKVKPTAEGVEEERKGLWANIHAKRKRGEKPNPPGHPDRPTAADFKRSQK